MASPSSDSPYYPLACPSALLTRYLGAHLDELPTPAVVLDRAVVRRNCRAMLNVCGGLGVGFRPHVKSHKTIELAAMQVGETGPANFVVSTVAEAELLAPYLRACQEGGRDASIIYGVPVPMSAIPRLVALAEGLAPRSVHVIIDNEDAFGKFRQRLVEGKSTVEIGVFVKIDTGYHRAGLQTTSPRFNSLVATIVNETASPGPYLQGFYSHFGHSYAGNSAEEAANGLIEELLGLEAATKALPQAPTTPLILSVGATPTATAAQTLLSSDGASAQTLRTTLARLQTTHHVELHAGVYPLLDCQQLATQARPSSGTPSASFQPLSKANIAMTVLLEVTSTYTERAQPEALVSGGSFALGREPCKSYPGWGIVSDALGNAGTQAVYEERGSRTGWIVGRISQEHGILTWAGDAGSCNVLRVGDSVRVWPNHACVAGAGFGWYFVVDGEEGGGERVVDVWVRGRGW